VANGAAIARRRKRRASPHVSDPALRRGSARSALPAAWWERQLRAAVSVSAFVQASRRAAKPARGAVAQGRARRCHVTTDRLDGECAGGTTRRLLLAALVAALVAGCGPGSKPEGFGEGGHEEVDLIVGSTLAGGGRLAVEYDFDREVEVTPSATLGGMTLFTSSDPGFDALEEDEPEESFFVLDDGTAVTVEITAIDPGAAVRIRGVTLDAIGEAAVLGTMPDLHHHPEWQLALPEGVIETRTLSFKLTAASGAYDESEEYTLTLVPVEE
jgi:hypothetical protein